MTLRRAFALVVSLALAVCATAESVPFQTVKISIKGPTINQKNFTTWAAKDTIVDQFFSIQHCLPIAITLSVNSSFVSNASFVVNSTDHRSTYNVHPYVEKGILQLALNGTVQSQDLVNVTIQLPPAWASALFNATITGSGYVNYQLNTTLPKYQLQLSGAGYANMNNTAESLVVNADTNASFVGTGKFSDVVLNWASSGASIVSQASNAVIQKSGSGNIYIPKAINKLQLVQSGKGGVSSFANVDTATVVQSGSGGLFLGVATGANISYAGGKNTTYIQANGTANGVATVASVQYTTTGNGTLVFSAHPGAAYPAISVNGDQLSACLNVSKWSNKACNETAVPAIPLAPLFPPKAPKCKPPATWVLTNSDACYVNPLDGWVCQAIAPVNGGQTFAMVLVLLATAVILIYVNNL